MLATNHSIEMDSFLSQEEVTNVFQSNSSSNNVAAQKRDYAIGIGLILIVASLYTLSGFLTQDLYKSGYDKPFLLTYMNVGTHSLCLIPFLLLRWWNRSRRKRAVGEYYSLATNIDDTSEDSDEVSNPKNSRLEHPLPPLTGRQTARLAFICCWIGLIANWSSNVSLELTTVTSATILFSMSGFFTLVIGRVFQVETLGLVKIGAVMLSFSGVLLVSLSDSTSQPPTKNTQSHLYLAAVGSRAMLGDALALISALCGAIYVILLKIRVKEESRVDMPLLFGLTGLFNILLLWPIGLILHLTSAEIFELPHTKQGLYIIIINMAITISADYLCVLAMLKTTPLIVTVGLSLTIPFAVVIDILRKTAIHGTVVAGALMVVMSFVFIGLDRS